MTIFNLEAASSIRSIALSGRNLSLIYLSLRAAAATKALSEILTLCGVTDPHEVVLQMLPYIDRHIAQGGRLHQVTRHMLGLFMGRPGARGWRRLLSEEGHLGDPSVVKRALERVS